MNNLVPFQLPEASLRDLGWNLALGVLLSVIVGWHYSRRARTKVLRRDLGLVLPVIALTTLLVITVVKSSLALSLGLVGALSIVRFRTPIKEPEELAYIFLAIAIGLSLGADQREVACIATGIILIMISIIDLGRRSRKIVTGNILISLEVPKPQAQIDEILDTLELGPTGLNIRRIDQDEQSISITAFINLKDRVTLTKFSQDFESKFPAGRFSILDEFSFPNE